LVLLLTGKQKGTKQCAKEKQSGLSHIAYKSNYLMRQPDIILGEPPGFFVSGDSLWMSTQ